MNGYSEDELQKYAAYRLTEVCANTLWFHVPNGKHRNKKVAAELKKMGVKPGVADLLLFRTGGRASVAVELKIPKTGRQSKDQIKFQAHWEQLGNIYVIVRTPAEIDALQFRYGLD